MPRSYHVTRPPGNDDRQPLVIVLGQSGASGRGTAITTGFDAVAREQGFVVAYPQNTSWYWDDGRTAAGLEPIDIRVNDRAFITRMIDEIINEGGIDPERIYLIGYRDGAGMAYDLACATPDRFAALVTVQGLMLDYHTCPSGTTTDFDVFIVTSADNASSPPEGRVFRSRYDDSRSFTQLSLEATADHWMTTGGCDPDETRDRRTVDAFQNTACAHGGSVTALQLAGGGASWPRGGDRLNVLSLDMAEIIGAFLAGDDWAALAAMDRSPTGPGRSYVLHIPTGYDPDIETPLVVMLHPNPTTGSEFVAISDMNRIADRNGFIAVYPDALATAWDYLEIDPQDDVAFIEELIDDLDRSLTLDRDRIYVAGMSRGGFLAQRLACELPETFAGVALVASTLFPDLRPVCNDAPPVPLLMIHGTEDGDVPWDGLTGLDGDQPVFITEPVMDSLGYWTEHNGCTPEYTLRLLDPRQADDPTHIERYDFLGCEQPVRFFAVIGGGHAWPGVIGPLPTGFTGRVAMDMHAGEAIWAFFAPLRR
jgi:polyhydroxybutyrate depolymerase